MKREKREKMTKVLVVVMTIVFIASILPMFFCQIGVVLHVFKIN